MSDRIAENQEKPTEAVSKAVEPETYHTADIRDHLVELDALRGIAIWAVVMHHLLAQWRTNVGPVTVPWLGWDALEVLHFMPGVPLFYLLSGYLLTWTEGKRAKRGSYSLKSYAKRRVLRLVPAYYAAIVVVLLVWPRDTDFWDVLTHLTFTHGLTPWYARTMSPAFWSLTPEVVFYLLLPLLLLKLPKLWHRVALFVVLYLLALPTRLMVLQLAAERANAQYGEVNWFQFYASFPTTLLYLFIAGMLMRMMVERLRTRPMSPWQPRIAFVLFVVCGAYIVTTPGLGFLRFESLGRTVAWVELLMVQDITLIGFFAAAVLGAPVLRGLLKWRLLSFVGLISYSMFVFHQTVLTVVTKNVLRDTQINEWITRDSGTMWLSFSAYVAFIWVVVIAISYLGYRYIESPFLKIKPK